MYGPYLSLRAKSSFCHQQHHHQRIHDLHALSPHCYPSARLLVLSSYLLRRSAAVLLSSGLRWPQLPSCSPPQLLYESCHASEAVAFLPKEQVCRCHFRSGVCCQRSGGAISCRDTCCRRGIKRSGFCAACRADRSAEYEFDDYDDHHSGEVWQCNVERRHYLPQPGRREFDDYGHGQNVRRGQYDDYNKQLHDERRQGTYDSARTRKHDQCRTNYGGIGKRYEKSKDSRYEDLAERQWNEDEHEIDRREQVRFNDCRFDGRFQYLVSDDDVGDDNVKVKNSRHENSALQHNKGLKLERRDGFRVHSDRIDSRYDDSCDEVERRGRWLRDVDDNEDRRGQVRIDGRKESSRWSDDEQRVGSRERIRVSNDRNELRYRDSVGKEERRERRWRERDRRTNRRKQYAVNRMDDLDENYDALRVSDVGREERRYEGLVGVRRHTDDGLDRVSKIAGRKVENRKEYKQLLSSTEDDVEEDYLEYEERDDLEKRYYSENRAQSSGNTTRRYENDERRGYDSMHIVDSKKVRNEDSVSHRHSNDAGHKNTVRHTGKISNRREEKHSDYSRKNRRNHGDESYNYVKGDEKILRMRDSTEGYQNIRVVAEDDRTRMSNFSLKANSQSDQQAFAQYGSMTSLQKVVDISEDHRSNVDRKDDYTSIHSTKNDKTRIRRKLSNEAEATTSRSRIFNSNLATTTAQNSVQLARDTTDKMNHGVVHSSEVNASNEHEMDINLLRNSVLASVEQHSIVDQQKALKSTAQLVDASADNNSTIDSVTYSSRFQNETREKEINDTSTSVQDLVRVRRDKRNYVNQLEINETEVDVHNVTRMDVTKVRVHNDDVATSSGTFLEAKTAQDQLTLSVDLMQEEKEMQGVSDQQIAQTSNRTGHDLGRTESFEFSTGNMGKASTSQGMNYTRTDESRINLQYLESDIKRISDSSDITGMKEYTQQGSSSSMAMEEETQIYRIMGEDQQRRIMLGKSSADNIEIGSRMEIVASDDSLRPCTQFDATNVVQQKTSAGIVNRQNSSRIVAGIGIETSQIRGHTKQQAEVERSTYLKDGLESGSGRSNLMESANQTLFGIEYTDTLKQIVPGHATTQYGEDMPERDNVRLLSSASGMKGPSDAIWDMKSTTSPETKRVVPKEDSSVAGTSTVNLSEKSGNPVVRRANKSLWSFVADIIRLGWLHPSDSHKSDRKSGKSSSNVSSSSVGWFSGEDHNDDEFGKRSEGRSPAKLPVGELYFGTPGIQIHDTQNQAIDISLSRGPIHHDANVAEEGGAPYVSSTSSEQRLGNVLGAVRGDALAATDVRTKGIVVGSSKNSTTLVASETPQTNVTGNLISDGTSGSAIALSTSDSMSAQEKNVVAEAPDIVRTEVTEGELKRRKFQRNKQVLKETFEEWEEAYKHEAEQRKLDEFFMREALVEAQRAADSWEVPVGAVLVRNGEIIARGCNLVEDLRDSTAHAEMICIRDASNQLRTWRLPDTTLYVTLEPCPMCAGAILQSRISTVVWGAPNKLLGADGSWVRLFPGDGSGGNLDAGPVHPFHPKMTIRRGVLANECSEIMQQFFHLRRKNKKQEPPPRSTLSMPAHPIKFFTRMQNAFSGMFCL